MEGKTLMEKFVLGMSCLLAACMMSLSPQSLAAIRPLPELGDSSASSLSPLSEAEIAKQSLAWLETHRALVGDGELDDYLNALGYQLLSHSTDTLPSFKFVMIADNEINAFAVPGGVIGVNAGLVLASNSESELASVLAHEIAHISQHHAARAKEARKYDWLGTVASAAVMMAASSKNPQLATAAVASSQAWQLQSQISFTREHEREADRVGVQMLAASGFDPQAMADFFSTLGQKTRASEGMMPSYLRTHPMSAERQADSENRAAGLAYKQFSNRLPYRLMKMKLRVLASNDLQGLVRDWSAQIGARKAASNPVLAYGLARAYLKTGQAIAAQRVWQQIQPTEVGKTVSYALLGSEILTAQRKYAESVALTSEAYQSQHQPRSLFDALMTVLLQDKQYSQALQWLDTRRRDFPNDQGLAVLRAQCYAGLGQMVAQHQALADDFAEKGQFAAAIEQLSIALAAVPSDDRVTRAGIQSKLDAWRLLGR